MADEFDTQHPPFNLLTPEQQTKLKSSLDIAYFDKDELILAAGQPSEYVYIILKGAVAETDPTVTETDEEHQGLIGHYAQDDLFGAISIINGASRYHFNALEETISYLIPKAHFQALLEANQDFASFFHNSLAEKTKLLNARRQQDMGMDASHFMLAQVDQSCMREALVLDNGTSIREATAAMRERRVDCLLVQRGSQYGMVTRTDLLNAVVLNQAPVETNIAEIAHYQLLTVPAGDFLFNALILMTRHQIQRVVVFDGPHLKGIVELTDVLSYFSSQSHVIGLQIERAETLEELGAAARGMDQLVSSLVSQGVKIRFAMDLLAALNGRIIGKVFSHILPAHLHNKVCLLVMGSEGRGEQVLKTDQDNALILADDLEWPLEERQKVLEQFTQTLVDFGYPLCDGKIMVSNPEWVMTESQWTKRLGEWTASVNGRGLMNLAIFVDSHPVAGDKGMLTRVRDWLFQHLSGKDVFYSYFGRPMLNFGTPLTIFGGIKDSSHGIDIKKGGIFPIVHGARLMALEQRIKATNTFTRLEALAEKGALEKEFAANLAEALALFSFLRLKQQLKVLSGQSEAESSNHVLVQELNKLDRDLLREALHLVKEFKSRMSYRYHLER